MFIFQLIPPHFFPLKTILPENKNTFKEGKKTTGWGAGGKMKRTKEELKTAHVAVTMYTRL